MDMQSLDAEALCKTLVEQMRPHVSPATALVGIHTGGVWLAERLHRALGLSQPPGSIDVSFYRDDFGSKGLHPQPKRTEIPFTVEGADVIIVDDVLYTGRTIRAAIEALFTYGRPDRVQLAVLVDRGHRELPIRPDYVGKNLPTARSERIQVQLVEVDEVDRVLLTPGGMQ